MIRTGYLLGRLLAALEHIGATTNPHQLYVQASVRPSVLVPVLARATTSGSVDILTPIVGQLPENAFDGELSNEDSGEFALGYYHQRADFRKGVLPALPETEPELDTRYEMRMDADLKAWTKANGGDKLIRALLRSARERHEA